MKIRSYFICICLAIQYWQTSQFEFTPEQRRYFLNGISSAEQAYKVYGVDFKLLHTLEEAKEEHRKRTFEELQTEHQNYIKFITFLRKEVPLLHKKASLLQLA